MPPAHRAVVPPFINWVCTRRTFLGDVRVSDVYARRRDLKIGSPIIESVTVPVMDDKIGVRLHQKPMHGNDFAWPASTASTFQSSIRIGRVFELPGVPTVLGQQFIIGVVGQNRIAVKRVYPHRTNPELPVSAMCQNACMLLTRSGSNLHELARSTLRDLRFSGAFDKSVLGHSSPTRVSYHLPYPFAFAFGFGFTISCCVAGVPTIRSVSVGSLIGCA